MFVSFYKPGLVFSNDNYERFSYYIEKILNADEDKVKTMASPLPTFVYI